MRNIAIVIVIAIVVAVVAYFRDDFFKSPSNPIVESTTNLNEARCSVTVIQNGKPVQLNSKQQVWVISVSGTHSNAPEVKVSGSSTTPPGISGNSCELKITKVPGTPLEGTDWRIGFTQPVDIASLRGHKAHVAMTLKADRAIQFGGATIYVYDGVGVKDSVSIPSLGENWQTFALDTVIDPNATTFEFWLRLGIHTAVSTTGTVYMADPKIELF